MVTWVLTFVPIQTVLLNGGEMEFGNFSQECMSISPERIRDVGEVERALKAYVSCLKYDDSRG